MVHYVILCVCILFLLLTNTEGFIDSVEPSYNAFPNTYEYSLYVPGLTQEIPIIQSDFPESVVKASNEMTMYEVHPYYKVIPDMTPDVSCLEPGYLEYDISDPDIPYHLCRSPIAD